jgi:hypothetical protein
MPSLAEKQDELRVLRKREELQALRLEAPKEPTVDAPNAAIAKFAQGITAGTSDEVIGGVQAASDWLIGRAKGETPKIGDLYTNRRDERRALYKAADAEQPGVAGTAEVAGGLALGLSPLGRVGQVKNAAGTAARWLIPAGQSAVWSAAQGAGYSEGKTVGAVAQDAAVSGGLGAVGSAALQGLGGGVKAASAKIGLTQAAKQGFDWVKDKSTRGAKAILSTVGGVHPTNVDEYLTRAPAINGARDVEGIKNAIDADVAQYVASADAAQSAIELHRQTAREAVHSGKEAAANAKIDFREARTKVEDRYRQMLADLKTKAVPTQVADDLVGALNLEKQTLGTLSEQALDALERTGGSAKRDQVVKYLDDIIKAKGIGKNKVVVGDETLSAVGRVQALRDRIAGMEEGIPLTDMKAILKQISPDINWNQRAGEFNAVEDRMKKDFYNAVSEHLKDKSPEYAQYMARMSELSKSLEEMSKFFGTRERALSTLESIVAGKKPIQDEALQRFAKNTGASRILLSLDEYRLAHETLRRAKAGDIAQELAPAEYRDMIQREAALQKILTQNAADTTSNEAVLAQLIKKKATAETEREAFRRLTPISTQSIVKNLGGPNARIEDRKAVEALERAIGKKYLDEIRDAGVASSFTKDATRGSKGVNIGISLLGGATSAVGSALDIDNTGIVGGAIAIGGLAGALRDSYGPRMTKRILDSYRKRGPEFQSAVNAAAKALTEAKPKGEAAYRAAQFYVFKQFPQFQEMLEERPAKSDGLIPRKAQ